MNVPEFSYTVLLKPAPLRALANACIRALLPTRLNYRGLQLALNPRDPVVSGALRFGLYENGEVHFFERILRPGQTVVDVGANIGLYTALAARAIGPTGCVIALEPEPETFGFLQQTIAANGFSNVELHQIAASANPGSARLYRNPDNRGDSRLYDDPLLKDSVAIETTTLDTLLHSRSVDVLKIDAQGAEGLILAGATGMFDNSPNLTIVMEFWPYGLERTGYDARTILDQLAARNFRLWEATGQPLRTTQDFDTLISRLHGRRYTNLIATRRKDVTP